AAEQRGPKALGSVAGQEQRIVLWRRDDGLVRAHELAVAVVVKLADHSADGLAPQPGYAWKADHATFERDTPCAAGAGVCLPVEGHRLPVARSAPLNNTGGAKLQRRRRGSVGEPGVEVDPTGWVIGRAPPGAPGCRLRRRRGERQRAGDGTGR